MADITWNQAVAQWKAGVAILDAHDLYCNANTPNYVGLEESVIDILRGDAADRITAQLSSFRASLSARLTPEAVRAFLTPIYQDLMSAIGKPDRGFTRNAVELRDYMVDQSESVKARSLTQGAVSAGGGNTGNGNVYRLLFDQDDLPLQGCYAEAVDLVCVQDQISVDEFQEVFEYRGAKPEKDFAKLGGSGLRKLIASLSARNVESFLRNPSFDVINGTQPSSSTPVAPAATTSIPGWVLSATAPFTVTIDDIVRGSPGVSVPKALRWVGNGSVTQILQDNAKPRVGRPDEIRVPYLLAPSFIRKNSATGTVTMNLGSQTKAVTIGSLTNDTPSRQPLDLDSSLYYANWKEQDADVGFAMASLAVGQAVLDDVVLTPMVLINGLWYAVIGLNTSWLYGDSYSITDSESTRGKMQYWSSFRTGLSASLGWAYTLPSSALGYETVTDP